MTKRWVFTSLLVFVVITLLMVTHNDAITIQENLNRPMPFLTAYILSVGLMLLMAIETPINHERRWWEVWKIYDPLTMVLYGFLFAIGVYLFGVYGNFSGRFRLKAEAFDWARFVLYISSTIGIIVIPYLVYRAWVRATSDRRRRTAAAIACYCYGMVMVGWIFHEVSVEFAAPLITFGTSVLIAVWGWEWYAARNHEDTFDHTKGLP